jgi:hypothetical protein
MRCLRSWATVALGLALLSATAAGDHRRLVQVPPADEIEVLDPGVDPVGNPKALFVPGPVPGTTGVTIPPTVVVHKFYYTSTRSFQGPMLPGGPSIVVVNHPRTGEQLYLEVQLLPGAPRVCYTDCSIEYDYGHKGITIHFPRVGVPRVRYREHVPPARVAVKGTVAVAKGIHHVAEESGASDLVRNTTCHVLNAGGAAVRCVRTVGECVVAPVGAVVKATPLGSVFTADPTNRAIQERDAAVRRARERDVFSDATIPTVR